MPRHRRRRSGRSVATRGLLLALSLLAFGATQASAASPTQTLGVYHGARDVAGVQSFSSWLGHDVSYALDFTAGGSWAEISDPNWWVDGWSGSGYRVIYSIPMLPPSGASLQAGANGDYNHHFVKLAQNLVARGADDAILRIGWEFNGNWFPWTAKDDPAAFAAYWRQIVTAMRSVPGQSFEFDWNPTAGKASVAPDRAYPGDAYVDYIGTDIYDMSWIANHTDPVARWADFESRPYGLDWHVEFAAAHGKPISIPEWGLAKRTDGHGGGDNPYFITQMHRWISDNNVAYQAYFEAETSIEHRMQNGSFPKAARRFKRLFGPGGSVASGSGKARTVTKLKRTPRTRRRGRVAGRVRGAARGKVVLRIQRKVAPDRWKRAGGKRKARVSRNGRFHKSARSLPRRIKRHGVYRVRARYQGSAGTRASISRFKRFRIGR